MARCEELEAILQAQFELEYGEPDALDERLRRLNFLLDQVIAGTALTRMDSVVRPAGLLQGIQAGAVAGGGEA